MPTSRIVSATQKQRLLTIGSDRSASHGTSLFEHYHASTPNNYVFECQRVRQRMKQIADSLIKTPTNMEGK